MVGKNTIDVERSFLISIQTGTNEKKKDKGAFFGGGG